MLNDTATNATQQIEVLKRGNMHQVYAKESTKEENNHNYYEILLKEDDLTGKERNQQHHITLVPISVKQKRNTKKQKNAKGSKVEGNKLRKNDIQNAVLKEIDESKNYHKDIKSLLDS